MLPRSYYSFILRHSLLGRDPDTDAGSIIVFGPDGQASVVAPPDTNNNPPDGTQAGAPQVIQNPPGQAGNTAPQQAGGAIPVQAPTISPTPPSPTLAVTSAAPELESTAAVSATTATSSPSPVTSTPIASDPVFTSSASSASQETPMSSSALTSAAASSTLDTSTSTSSPTTIPISTPVQSAAALTASASATSSASHSGLYIGIALACIAGLLVLTVLIATLLRIRFNRRKRELEVKSAYSRRDQERKESYLGSGKSPGTQHEKYYGGYAPYIQHPPDIHIDNDTYPDDILDSYSSNNSPLPPSVLSAPDLTGRVPLQVTNMMPGDAYMSSDETSRPATSLAILRTPPVDDFGTPREDRPRFLGLKDGGLDLPWAPVNREQRLNNGPAFGDDLEQGIPEKDEEDQWEPLPFPGESHGLDARQQEGQGKDKPTETNMEAWTASLRANLTSVLNMAGGYLTSNTSAPPPEDKFTSIPTRNRRNSIRFSQTRRLPGATLARENTNHSRMSNLYTLEEVEENSGTVRVRGVEDTPPLSITKKPPSVMVKSRQRTQLCVPPSGTVTRASSVYSNASATSTTLGIGSKVPRLPSIPPLSRNITIRHDGFSSRDGALPSRDSLFRNESGSQPRPKIMTRLTSNCSATSVGSDMSRDSAQEERLTDEEKMVQQALRERRKRVMSMGMGRGRPGSFRMGSMRANSSRRSRGRSYRLK
ncbi:hypothetical protein NEOLEDRAFT_1141485 [Neolentinus lepideus HHB14362 ss-1]|uniref:Uncharacterized protein n=1 Tax=Neolentinus lepideus HHB14362 ss-1 TaxID=1314782 RepID=A0A165NMT7_9AGAM|nr:hypothetical protein NEOLEDRAFT_1141485 [Neolentinus lepideus HHB14362 ss-1]